MRTMDGNISILGDVPDADGISGFEVCLQIRCAQSVGSGRLGMLSEGYPGRNGMGALLCCVGLRCESQCRADSMILLC